MAETAVAHPDVPGFTPATLSVRVELSEPHKPLATLALGPLSIEARRGNDTLWLIVRRPGKGGIALHTVPAPGPVQVGKVAAQEDRHKLAGGKRIRSVHSHATNRQRHADASYREAQARR